jgi:steroid 5-alpha reductase family enzyme
MIAALAASGIFLVLAMAGAWVVQRRTGNSGWIDTTWSFAVGVASVLGLLLLRIPAARRWLLILLVAAWSLRLGAHILARTTRISDDPRYARLMAEWGQDAAPRRLFWFLQAQALAGGVLVLAILLAALATGPVLAPLTLVFSALALVSVVGEAMSDAQLAAFKREAAAGSLCERGLWSLSRHPNYFFEWLFWVSVSGLAISAPWGWVSTLALVAPLMMYVLLRYGSGVPHLEAHMRRTRPEAFAAYAARVPEFFPRIQWSR